MSLLDRFRLDGKVAIVTGASSGLGVAFAEGLAEAGADVAICARRAERLEETRKRVEGAGPSGQDDQGRIVSWSTRIIPASLDLDDVVVPGNDHDDDDDIDVPVERL